jgi:hypothetical protein
MHYLLLVVEVEEVATVVEVEQVEFCGHKTLSLQILN